jgi:hypothetical protein
VRVWLPGQAFWLFVPASAAGCFRGESCERFEALGEVIGHPACRQVCLQGVGSLVGLLLHRGVFERAVHAFHWPIRPGRGSGGQPMVAAIRLTGAITEMRPCVWLALAVGTREVLRGQHGGALGRYGGAQEPSALRGARGVGSFMPLGLGTGAGPGHGDTAGARAFVRAPLRAVDLAVTERRGLARLLGRRLAGPGREAADALPLPAAMPCRSPQVRQRGVQGSQAVIQRPQRLLANRDPPDFCLSGQDGGTWWLQAHGCLVHRRPLLPLRHGCGMHVLTLGQLGEALVTRLERTTHRRGRAGAAVPSLSPQASREGQS